MRGPLLVRLGLLLLLGPSACGDPPLLDLKLVVPEGPDPLATADRLRLVVTEPPAETSLPLGAGGGFSLELKVEVAGAVGSVILEGFAGDRLVARGETPPLLLRPEEQQLSLLVGRAGDFSTLVPRLASPGESLSAVLLTARGLLLAGGDDLAGRPLASAALYDFYAQALTPVAALPEPRSQAVAASCGGSCALLLLGAGPNGLADRILRYQNDAWTALPDGLAPPERRRGAGIAALSDGTYLVVGGEGAQGPLDTALRLRPGAGSNDPGLELLASRSRAPRARPALAGTGTVVLLVGGQPLGGPAAELFYTASLSFQPLTLPGTVPASGAAASELADGKLVIVGGRDETGALIRDGWVVDPIALKVTLVPGCLGEGRADHQLVRAGPQLVVVGGVTASGASTVVEVLGPELGRIGQGALAVPRTGFAVGRLGPGSFLVAGGRASAGSAPAPLLEVFETGVASGL